MPGDYPYQPNQYPYHMAGSAATGAGAGTQQPPQQSSPWDWMPSMPGMPSILKGVGLGTLGLGIGGGLYDFMRPAPVTQTQNRIGPEAMGALGQSNRQLGMGGDMLGRLQQNLMAPQIPPHLAALVEQAFQPMMGNIAQQAIMSARNRGFSGGAQLLNEGPGGAVAGPMLADLQGQMAMAKLAQYQQWINSMLQASQQAGGLARGYQGTAQGYPTTQKVQQPKPSAMSSILGMGPLLQGVGSIFDALKYFK